MDSVWQSGKFHYAFSTSTLLYILKKSQLLLGVLNQYFPIVPLDSAIAPTLKTMKTMAWEPWQANSEETAPSLSCLAPWQYQVVSCLGSKQISPLKISLEWGAWHKMRNNQLKAALLDSQLVFPVIPHMELLECRTEKPKLISVFRRHPFDLTRTDASYHIL